MELEDSIQTIKGVGEQTAAKFQLLGVETVRDLLTFWPKRYDDYSEVTSIARLEPGTVTVKARVENCRIRRLRRGMQLTEALLRDGSSSINAIWFNQPYRQKQLLEASEFYFSGLYGYSYNRYVLQNPSVEKVAEFTKNTARIVPIYSQTKGLDSRQIRNLLAEMLPVFKQLPESLPPEMVVDNRLLNYAEAAEQMHWPADAQRLAAARQRIAFDEVFGYMLTGLLNKQTAQTEQAYGIKFNKQLATQFISQLPFKLTDGQRRATWQILQAIEKSQPMNLLLEGDVGSGKTVVAAFAAYITACQGFQTAIMAPTELLGRQHAATLSQLLEPLGISVALLTSAVKPGARPRLVAAIASGEAQIVVGTQALIQKPLDFHRLGLIVIDEQHRFGVAQRQKLIDKGLKMPHIMSMTATPIPRSLALTVYGEMDVAIIDEKPSNRLMVQTKIWSPNSRPQLYQLVEAQLRQGRQAFVVCPMIDETEATELSSVTTEAARLKAGPLKRRRIELLHGKMKDHQKAALMEQFAAGAIDILVATTVIEVGIDIPNASLIIIEGADRYGLAQLHQLRGRVGRGDHQAYCYLVPSDSHQPGRRLRAMETMHDGFKLAELDLELRGPGAIYGARQHGQLDLRVADINNASELARVKKAALNFVAHHSIRDYPILKKAVVDHQRLTYLN